MVSNYAQTLSASLMRHQHQPIMSTKYGVLNMSETNHLYDSPSHIINCRSPFGIHYWPILIEMFLYCLMLTETPRSHQAEWSVGLNYWLLMTSSSDNHSIREAAKSERQASVAQSGAAHARENIPLMVANCSASCTWAVLSLCSIASHRGTTS